MMLFKKPFLKTTLKASVAAIALSATQMAFAQTDKERIQALEEKVEALMQMLEQQAPQKAKQIQAAESKASQSSADSSHSSSGYGVHLGGYGELKANFINGNDEDINGESNEVRGLNFHRLVVFMGYDFSPKARFVSELEIEHVVASASKAGVVEIEQAYLEFDLVDDKSQQLRTGIILMPVGVVNEVHEPATFYGVERPIIETTLLPSTWWAGGVMYSQRFDSGISYDLFLSEGLKTSSSDPFNIKAGKQKTTSSAGQGGKADITNLATTGRIKYTGTAGLELSAYAQYQPDLDQGASGDWADSATMLGGHAIYQMGDWKATALYTRWDLEGDAAEILEQDVQQGGYVELSYKPYEKVGLFARHSEWSKKEGEDANQTDFGVNYWPYPEIVFKADFQVMNEYATRDTDRNILTEAKAFNLGMGYHF